jgi:hypothetical protein
MSEDLIENAERVISRLDPKNQGFYQTLPPEYTNVLIEMLAEIKRPRVLIPEHNHREIIKSSMLEQLAAKNNLLAQNQITIQMHHNNVLELQKEVARWRAIAIEATAKANYYRAWADKAHPTILVSWETQGDQYCISQHREQAAKELGLQISQGAGCMERLEMSRIGGQP